MYRFNVGSSEGASLVGGLGYVNPQMFGGIGSLETDNTAAVLTAIDEAVSRGYGLDLSGGPWRVTKTLDLTNVKQIHADYSGRILVDPENFTPAHTAKFVVTFGDPDTTYTVNRCTYTTVKGYLFVIADSRNAELNGVFIKGTLLDIDSIRALRFNGYGIRAVDTWDSNIKSLSTELSGNVSKYSLYIGPGDDTSNCLNIGRIQVERSYHKQFYLNLIRSAIGPVHAERLKILTLDDGATSLPSALTYENTYMLLSNCTLSQLIIDAAADAEAGTVSVTPSVRLSLHTSKAVSLALGSCIVTSTYGQDSTIENFRFYKYFNPSYPYTLKSGSVISSAQDGILLAGGAGTVIENCAIDIFQPDYNTTKLTINSCRINTAYSNIRTNVSGVTFNDCTFMANVGSTGPTEVNEPTTFNRPRILGTFTGAYQHRCIVNGGWAASVSLNSRAYAHLNNLHAGSFDYTGDIAFVTLGCRADVVTKWGIPAFGNHKTNQRTQRMGAIASGSVIEYVNTTDNGATFVPVFTLP